MKMRAVFLTLAVALGACDAADEGMSPAAGGGGKADEADGSDGAQQCPEIVELAQFVNNDHVQTRCRNPDTGAFVSADCGVCAEAIEQFTTASSCPPQAKWNDAEGSAKRCVADTADSDGGVFVPSSCCASLCEPAGWDDAEAQTGCRGHESGQFVASACCILNDAARCEGASFDQDENENGVRHCRVQSGDFSGQFAPEACCFDECFDAMEDSLNAFLANPTGADLFGLLEGVPPQCLEAEEQLDDECDGAETDDAGFCRREDGKFARSMCCFEDHLEPILNDRCFEAQMFGQELPECG